MTHPEPTICVSVDPTNPGQFFACCGLFELADRRWCGSEAWFGHGQFCIAAPGATLPDLLQSGGAAELTQLGPDDDLSPPMKLGHPFELRLDWWIDEQAGGKQLKVWAGSMRSVRIARAMQHTLRLPALQTDSLFGVSMVVYDPAEPDKKVEPYYFDGRRGANALALDIGFMPDTLKMTTGAYPAVEFLCLVGLQRARPAPTETPRVFDYFTWSLPLPISLLPAATTNRLGHAGGAGYRFENGFRTDQKKHKSFLPATPIGGSR